MSDIDLAKNHRLLVEGLRCYQLLRQNSLALCSIKSSCWDAAIESAARLRRTVREIDGDSSLH
jgi:hypothetical protein